MQLLHDVWVNWFEGEENGYNVCPFFEWRKSDPIELLDQIPLMKVNSSFFNYIENDLQEIPKQILDQIFQRSYVRKNHERTALDYACVFSDGSGIIAIDTLGYTIPVKKSRLIPRQEQLVYELLEDMETIELNKAVWTVDKSYHSLSLPSVDMIGLTRTERQMKQLLFMALDHLNSQKNVSELRYWYTEWSPERYRVIQQMDAETVWTNLYSELSTSWSPRHLELCENLIKGQPLFERIWEMENRSKVNEKSA